MSKLWSVDATVTSLPEAAIIRTILGDVTQPWS